MRLFGIELDSALKRAATGRWIFVERDVANQHLPQRILRLFRCLLFVLFSKSVIALLGLFRFQRAQIPGAMVEDECLLHLEAARCQLCRFAVMLDGSAPVSF